MQGGFIYIRLGKVGNTRMALQGLELVFIMKIKEGGFQCSQSKFSHINFFYKNHTNNFPKPNTGRHIKRIQIK